jgi:DNA-binding transcriptional ArsR family regulator/rhodanese-related sulfurtransferase
MKISTPLAPTGALDARQTTDVFDLWNEFASIAQALAHPYRLLILELLSQAPRDVETLTRLLNVRIATVSQHLQKLKHAALIVDERRGRHRVYRLSHPAIQNLVAAIGRVAELTGGRAEKLYSELFADGLDEPPVRPEELRRLLAEQKAILLDIRPREEYDYAHVPGAVPVSPSELASARERFPHGRLLVVTCRGRYCLLALDAIRTLRNQGFRVRRYDEGTAAAATLEHDVPTS